MIKYIEYQKKKYPIRISYYALKHTSEDTGTSISSITDKGNDAVVFEKLLYYGLKAGCRAENIEMPFKEDDMEFVLDEIFFEFTDLVKDFFPKAKEGEDKQVVKAKKK